MKSYRLCSFKKEWLNNEALLLSLSRVQFLSDSRTLEKKPLSPYEVTPPFKEEHFYFLFRFFGGSNLFVLFEVLRPSQQPRL